ncbi:uncharacterized protein PSANT_03968 [Moesziomyces antarcticus]|uniref:Uncharacterized protein n=1 Tax=Pseudozyma antarctica TaxID=84753 RepID=A0A5C3FPJ1_PSEA2|nr:uncharacterized protein PSANT_03968 [Moesziomyces antarcticus]
MWTTLLLAASRAAAAPMLPETIAEEASKKTLEALRQRLTPLQLPRAPHQFAYQFPPAPFTNKVDELEFDLVTLPKIRTKPAREPKPRVYTIMEYETPSPPYLTAKTDTSSTTTDPSSRDFSS